MSAWQYRCPHGHSSLRFPHTKDHYACGPCGEKWPSPPVNLEEETLPDESEIPEPIGEREDEQ
jgi:hypothetical protein